MPDYELDRTLDITTEAQLKALADPFRMRLTSLVLERAATTSQLAEVVDRPVGTVGHHLKVLEEAGLIRVVRTRKVRAMTERYYGRVAITYVFHDLDGAPKDGLDFVREAMREARHDPATGAGPKFTIRYARISDERRDEWFARLAALAEEFAVQPRDGDVTHGILLGVFPTDWRQLPADASAPDDVDDPTTQHDTNSGDTGNGDSDSDDLDQETS